MRWCYGCFNQVDENVGTCPYCGYVDGTGSQNPLFLSPGTSLSGIYIVGRVLSSDNTITTYLAWDNTSGTKVTIKEYLPVDCVTRNPQTNAVAAIDENASAVFDKGFFTFVEEAKRLFKEGSDVKLYDCIAENETAYMIMEYTEGTSIWANNQTQQGSASNTGSNSKVTVTVPEDKSGENKIMSFIKGLPLWVKILVPSVLVIFILGIAVAIGASGESDDPDETDVSETTAETEATEDEEIKIDNAALDASLLRVRSFSFKGHTYAYYDNAGSWEEAEKYCESLGGHLAVITSKEENDAICAFTKDSDNQGVFIGLSDSETEGTWKWVTGETASYTNWSKGQPDGYTDDEDYAEISYSSGGLWNDYQYVSHKDGSPAGFICEWDYDVSNPVSDKAITKDEALKAFQYHVANALVSNDVRIINDDSASKMFTASWKQLSSDNNTCVFSFETNSGECFVYYTDLPTGVTTSIKYENNKCESVISIGESDYNAFQYLTDIEKYSVAYDTKDLKDYLRKSIRTSADEIGGFSFTEYDESIDFENDDIYFSASRESSSEKIRYIQLRGWSGKYRLYGIAPGTSFRDAIIALTLAGAENAVRIDNTNYVVTMEDGTAVTISTVYEWDKVSHVSAKIK